MSISFVDFGTKFMVGCSPGYFTGGVPIQKHPSIDLIHWDFPDALHCCSHLAVSSDSIQTSGNWSFRKEHPINVIFSILQRPSWIAYSIHVLPVPPHEVPLQTESLHQEYVLRTQGASWEYCQQTLHSSFSTQHYHVYCDIYLPPCPRNASSIIHVKKIFLWNFSFPAGHSSCLFLWYDVTFNSCAFVLI